jgi:hypothetical protein
MIATILLCALALPDSGAPWASLTITTGNDSAVVVMDSVRRGMTPLTVDSLAPGTHILRLAQGEMTSWLTGTLRDTVRCIAGEHRTLRYSFPRRVMIVTDPSGAMLFAGDSAIGATPIVLAVPPDGVPGGFSAVKDGYERAILPLPPGGNGITRAALHKLWQSEPPEGALVKESNGTRSSFNVYAAGGVTLIAGAAAAYFKIKADNRNADYQASGNPALRDETRRLDTAAAVSLLVTQIGFGFLTYVLLAD